MTIEMKNIINIYKILYIFVGKVKRVSFIYNLRIIDNVVKDNNLFRKPLLTCHLCKSKI